MNEKNKSKLSYKNFLNKLTSFFGWRSKPKMSLYSSDSADIEFVNVDLNNPSKRSLDALISKVFSKEGYTEKIENLLKTYLKDVTTSQENIRATKTRLDELTYMKNNDPFISRVVLLVADEATQVEEHDRLITVQTADPKFTEAIYKWLDKWGITQARAHGVCYDLELYGEAFWANKITSEGVQKIIPLSVYQVVDRLEFKPTQVLEEIQKRFSSFTEASNRDSKFAQLLADLQNDMYQNFAELFETKLLGFLLADGEIVPPWAITHFRYDEDHSPFFPRGNPPLLACLAPFKQLQTAIALQGLARMSSLPITTFGVKLPPGTDPSLAWEKVNEMRETFDNLGTELAQAVDVYTINTKIWYPEGILSVNVINPNPNISFIEDMKLYQDRLVVASGLVKAYISQDWALSAPSAASLVEQHKPFARHVFTIRSIFLKNVADLIRLHLYITNEFPPNSPFILSMKLPASKLNKNPDEYSSSLKLAGEVIEFFKSALGVGADEPLPPNVVKDIIAKFTFLNPVDIIKWSKSILIQKTLSGLKKGEGGEEDMGGSDFDFGGGGVGGGFTEPTPTDMGFSPTSPTENFDTSEVLNNVDLGGGQTETPETNLNETKIRRLKQINRLKEIARRYESMQNELIKEAYHKLRSFNCESNGYHHYMSKNLNSKLNECIYVFTDNTFNRPKPSLRSLLNKMREEHLYKPEDLSFWEHFVENNPPTDDTPTEE